MVDKITFAGSALNVDLVFCATSHISAWSATSIAVFCVSIRVGSSCRVTESEYQDGRAFSSTHKNCLDMYSAGKNKLKRCSTHRAIHRQQRLPVQLTVSWPVSWIGSTELSERRTHVSDIGIKTTAFVIGQAIRGSHWSHVVQR